MSPATRSRTPAKRTRGTAARSRGPAPAARGWQHHKTQQAAKRAARPSLAKRAKAARVAWRGHPVRRARARYKRIPRRRRGALFACVGAALAVAGLTALAIEGTALTIAAEANWVGAGISMGISAWELHQDRKQRAVSLPPSKPAAPAKPRTAKPKPAAAVKRAPHCPCQCAVHGQPAKGKTCNCICAAYAKARAGTSTASPTTRHNGSAPGARRKAAAPPPRP